MILALTSTHFTRKPSPVITGHCKRRKAFVSLLFKSSFSSSSSTSSSIKRTTSLFPTFKMSQTLLYTLLTWACLVSLTSAMAQCPKVCQCNWASGKTIARCANVQLSVIPKDIYSLTQVLHLEDNDLRELPARVFHDNSLRNLQKLFLARTKLSQIDKNAFYRLTNLIDLDLSSNFLTEVPSESLSSLTFLRRLRLDGNPLKRIRSGAFSFLTQLNFLNLSYSQIDTLEPDAFEGLGKLQYLLLEGNRLTTFAENVFARLPPLYSLALSYNPWNCDCEMRPARQWIDSNNIHLTNNALCASPPSLANKPLKSIPKQQFACVPAMLSVERRITAQLGTTAFFQCQVRTVAESSLTWRVQLDNGSWAVVTETSDPNTLDGYGNSYALYNPSSSHQLLDGRIRLIAPLQSSENEEVLIGKLQVRNVSSNDNGRRFSCIATNEAGSTDLNFTLTTQAGSALVGTASAMAGAVTGPGGLFFLILLLLSGLILAAIAFAFNRRMFCFNSSDSDQAGSFNKSALPSLDVLKHIGKGNSSNNNNDNDRNGISNHHTSQAGLLNGDSLEKRSMNNGVLPNKQIENASSSGYGSNGVTPDLTSCVLKMQHSASYAQLAANVGCPPTDLSVTQPHYDYGYNQTNQHDTYGYLPANTHQGDYNTYLQTLDSSQPTYGAQMYQPSHHGYPSQQSQSTIANYENMYDNSGAYASQPMLIGAGPVNDPMAGFSSSAYPGPSVMDPIGYSIDNSPMYWSNNGSATVPSKPNDQPSTSGSLNGITGGHVNLLPQPYLGAQPTVVRYSPDEGYAEETANTPFTLEGTEV